MYTSTAQPARDRENGGDTPSGPRGHRHRARERALGTDPARRAQGLLLAELSG